jgi:hypothetical protein
MKKSRATRSLFERQNAVHRKILNFKKNRHPVRQFTTQIIIMQMQELLGEKDLIKDY